MEIRNPSNGLLLGSIPAAERVSGEVKGARLVKGLSFLWNSPGLAEQRCGSLPRAGVEPATLIRHVLSAYLIPSPCYLTKYVERWHIAGWEDPMSVDAPRSWFVGEERVIKVSDSLSK